MKSYLVIFLTLFVSGLNFLYGILNTRFLGLNEIGIYSLIIQSINTLVLISDLGLSTAFLKFYSENYGKDKKTSDEVLTNSFYLKGIISLILILAFSVSLPLRGKDFIEYLGLKRVVIMLSTIFTISISELLMSKYRAQGKFKSFFIYKFIMAFMRLIPMGVFYYKGLYNLNLSMDIFTYSAIAIVILLLFDQKELFKEPGLQIGLVKKLFHFSKWIFLSNISLAFILNGTLELYYLKLYATKEDLGYFSALLIFFTILNVLNTSLTTLFFPKFASCTREELILQVNKAFKMGVVLALPLIMLIPFIKIFIKLTIGERYMGAYKFAVILLLAFFIELISQVFRLVLYIKANKNIAFINVCQFIGSALLGFVFIGILKIGILGAVLSIFIVRVIGAVYMWNSYKKVIAE